MTELRTRIDAQRTRFGLAGYAWTDPTLVTGETRMLAQHLIDLRTALSQAYTAAGQTPPSYVEMIEAGVTPVKALHIAELRAAVIALE